VEYDYQISALTLAEVLVHPTKLGVEKRVMDNIQSLGMAVMPLPSESAAPLAKLRVQSGLKMPDVVVLNQALAVGAPMPNTKN
jgi:PIN domain nuclease of toxin-antitoxin system